VRALYPGLAMHLLYGIAVVKSTPRSPLTTGGQAPGFATQFCDVEGDPETGKVFAIAYDWKSASARAERNGRPEWAHGLRTGWFRRC